MLEHGGAIIEASRRWGVPVDKWLDLSTCINPQAWTVPPIPESCWHRLPQHTDELIQAAQNYYGNALVLPTAGSQASIMALPDLREHSKVAVISPTYEEHFHAWASRGHEVMKLAPEDLETHGPTYNVVVLCNPNNPTGKVWDPQQLHELSIHLGKKNGWLIVDESFMDATPELSLIPKIGQPGLIVLRSFAKFFGLPGARVGFAFAWPLLLSRLEDKLGPWTVNGPGRWVATQALLDKAWHDQARSLLKEQSHRLRHLLTTHGLEPNGGTAFFQWVKHNQAGDLYETLAKQGILVRQFRQPSALRFGLPGTNADWRELEKALLVCNPTHSREPIKLPE